MSVADDKVRELRREYDALPADADPKDRQILALRIENAQLVARQVERRGLTHLFQAQGHILILESGIVVVPYEIQKNGANVVVVGHTEDADKATKRIFKVGGYNLWIGEEDILRARESWLAEGVAW